MDTVKRKVFANPPSTNDEVQKSKASWWILEPLKTSLKHVWIKLPKVNVLVLILPKKDDNGGIMRKILLMHLMSGERANNWKTLYMENL
ncbi:unnamed protein product [Lathyrus sativus]|nr:unnamed protein product [Lathyrus sativus]